MESVNDGRRETMQSEQIEKVAAALVAAQGEMSNPPKSKTVHAGVKRYSFAPLPEILDVVRPVLKKHGLAVTQLVGNRVLETRLIHTTGQWIGATYTLPDLADSQAMGSAITYARRYSLCAILGIAAEDDEDGEAAAAAEQAEADAKRKEAEKRLDALKGKGSVRSAYDGKVLAAGEATLPSERTGKVETTDHGPQTTDPRPQTADRKPGKTAGPEAPALPDGKHAAETAAATTGRSDGFAGIAGALADLMKTNGITPDALKRYYVGKGHLPESVGPADLPADYVAGLTKPENWKRAVSAMKGGSGKNG